MASSATVVIDGAVVDPAVPCVSVFDSGFLYGDGVFDVLRTYHGRPFCLEEHIDRLRRSARIVGMDETGGREQWSADVRLALEAAEASGGGEGDRYVRLVLTRGEVGVGLRGHKAGAPTRAVLVMPLEPYPPALYEGGAALVTDPHPYVPGESAGAKVLSYQPHLLALRRARAAGAQDALRVDPQGQVVEGATSNVFVVFGRGLREPPASAGRLDGITARVVRGLAALEGFPVTATPVVPSEVYRADEVFITSSIREVMPVVEVDGRPISDGRPGPVARRLVEKYRAVARAR